MRFRSLWRKGKQQKDRLARLLTEGAALFLLLPKNTLLYTVEPVRTAKNIANKKTHSSNREKGEIEKYEPHKHKHTVANSSTTFRDETDAVQVPLEKGKAAKRQIRTIADRRRGAVFVVAKKYTTVHSRNIQ
jgi:hypothetical protein